MSESKSTDKLIAVNDIITATLRSLSQEKRDKLSEVTVTWESISGGEEDGDVEHVPCPNLSLKFAP